MSLAIALNFYYYARGFVRSALCKEQFLLALSDFVTEHCMLCPSSFPTIGKNAKKKFKIFLSLRPPRRR